MNTLIRIDLFEPGIEYVNSRLRDGRALSRAVLEASGGVGNAFTVLPKQGLGRDISSFESGGLTSEKATLDWLDGYIRTAASTDNLHCIVEDIWMDPSDVKVTEGVHFAGNTVLRVMPAPYSRDALQRLIMSVASFSYNGFLFRSSPEHPPLKPTVDMLPELARRVSMVIVDAFDREGLVIADVSAGPAAS